NMRELSKLGMEPLVWTMVARAPRRPAFRIRTISSKRSMVSSRFSLRRVVRGVNAGGGPGDWTVFGSANNIMGIFECGKESSMKAIVFAKHGGPEVLEYREVAEPEVRTGEVLVKVHACALNH